MEITQEKIKKSFEEFGQDGNIEKIEIKKNRTKISGIKKGEIRNINVKTNVVQKVEL